MSVYILDQMPPKHRIPPAKQTSEEAAQKLMGYIPRPSAPRPTVSWGIVELPVDPLHSENRKLVNNMCEPYLKYGNHVRRRIAELKSEIDQIDKEISEMIALGVYAEEHELGSRVTIRYQTVLDTLTRERLQKADEMLHFQDNLSEINEEIKRILIKYEDRRMFVHRGGTRRRTRSKPKRTNGR